MRSLERAFSSKKTPPDQQLSHCIFNERETAGLLERRIIGGIRQQVGICL
jgi:hypothetical protein